MSVFSLFVCLFTLFLSSLQTSQKCVGIKQISREVFTSLDLFLAKGSLRLR